MEAQNALTATCMLTRDLEGPTELGIPFGSFEWFFHAGISCFLVLFAGIMSGLALGLMSLGLVDLEILQQSGSPKEKRQAAAILPVVQKQHQLLVTLLLCNAAAVEALPIYLDKLFNQYVAIILSVTSVLAFGEVIPQSICSRYGLAVGANFIWLVRILMIVCYPVAYPIGKILDRLLGPNKALFRRAQLKALVSIHSRESGKGGELTHEETTIISGALDLTEKTAEGAMTPIESTFSLDINSRLDREAMKEIIARGHSRVPIYSRDPKNISGFLLDLLTVLTGWEETEPPLRDIPIRKIPRIRADMPLYDILHEFQNGKSHIATVVKPKGKCKTPPTFDGEKYVENNPSKPASLQQDDTAVISEDPEDGEVVGIITLEDVFEELLQEEILDETDDYYVPVDKRNTSDVFCRDIGDAAAPVPAPALSRSLSIRRLTLQKAAREIVGETDEHVDVHRRKRMVASAPSSPAGRAPFMRRMAVRRAAGCHNKRGLSPK